MNEKIKNVLRFVALELILFCGVSPTGDFFHSVQATGFRPLLGYLFFVAAVTAALFIGKPAVFFPLWALCSAGDFLLDKRSLLLLAPASLTAWLLMFVVFPQLEKEGKEKLRFGVGVAVTAVAAALFIAAFPLSKNAMGGYSYILRFYLLPWIVTVLWYWVKLLQTSRTPAVLKLKEKIKSCTE